ncbi:hypothetical protein NHX12_014644 [Muraenolepis orangiensis]|uniref:C2H2-type domain-containing protein n=1 Tax=Muraenolepis orangiensis TaxID=630683 RepID=A0A9Q0DAR3_9TELE|nr:hypothetical protein NHX12_014644 [Muraenolepis orangiensis]
MAEEDAACSLPELAGLDRQLDRLSARYSRPVDSGRFCSEFCQMVEQFSGLQGSPEPQLRVLEVSLCYFFTASSFLPPHCDHVSYTLSSLALSVFELLLFFDQKDFSQDTLQHLAYTFQECPAALARHPNPHLLQLRRVIGAGGPWADRVLLDLLSEADVPQAKVDGFLGSEAPLFLELRVRFLLSAGRGREAAALARRCAAHPGTRQRPLFLQVCVLGGAEVLQVVCGMERQEEGGVLLCVCRAALAHLLLTGHMSCLWQLVCVWGSLHRRQQTSRLELLEESRHLLQSATNVTAIFPFIRVLLEELGDTGLQFCVELCSRALRSGLVSDGSTGSLVYKTVAGLLPRDLEVCRACALLVFFQERTLEAYRTVVRLYSLPDQEYNAETSPVGNHVRFDLLQVLKKGLLFDPEFWNVAAIRSNCRKLLSGKARRSAREEVPEESQCTKEAHQPSSTNPADPHRSEVKESHKNGLAPKRTRLCRGNVQLPGDSALQKKNKRTQRAQLARESGEFLRRSFWQSGKTSNGFSSPSSHGEQRRITRFSAMNRPKRRIRTPRWLLEDSGTLEENTHRNVKKLLRKRQQEEAQEREQEKSRALVKRNTSTLPKTGTKEKHLVKCDLAEKQSVTRHIKGLSLDYLQPASPAHVILELSLPDNELSDIFTDESFSRRNCLPPVLLYKKSVSEPLPSQSNKAVHLKRVIIRAPDEISLAQQLHCYARRNKHLAVASRIQSKPSVVTRSSAQAPPTKGRRGQPRSKPLVEMKVTIASQTPVRTRASQSPLLNKGRATAAREGSRPSDNETSLVAHRSLAPGDLETKTDRKLPNAVANAQLAASGQSSKEAKVFHDVGRSNACKDLAPFQIGGVSDSAMTDAPAKDSNASLKIASNLDSGGHVVGDVTESVGHDAITGRASDGHGSYIEEDLHGLRLLSETVSALAPAAPQSSPEAPGAPVQQRSMRGNKTQDSAPKTVTPASPPVTKKSACSLSEPDSEEDLVQEPQDGGDQTSAPPECKESRLEYRCTLCDNKMFKGKRVVVHAMFHYRRDKCMFCGVLFKDDILAMMHLSEHIDKLKKLTKSEHKRLGGNFPQRSTELPPTSPPPTARGLRPRKSLTTPPPAVPNTAPSESMRLRSDRKFSKGSTTPFPRPKVNGHIKTGSTGDRQHTAAASPLVPNQNAPPLPLEKDDVHDNIDNGPGIPPRLPKPIAKRQEAVSAVATETCCPVVVCDWHADLSRSPLALLYHALEDHHQDDAPLQLAFHMGNGQCSVCLRVLWSFRHYRHHVERHRLTPRHPCLHQGCGARFKNGIEMRRHSRKHSPLQASCCMPGCAELFICLWALNLHEREHYSEHKDTKSAKAHMSENRGHRKTERMLPGSGLASAVTTLRRKGCLAVREPTVVPSASDAQSDPRTTGKLGKECSTLRRSQDSKHVEGVQVPTICSRKTHSRQRIKQMDPTSPSSLVITSRRMRRRLENRQVKLKVISHKTKNLHLLSTQLSKNASGKKLPCKRRCKVVEEEERSLDQNFTVASKAQEQSSPNIASTAQEQTAPLASTAQELSSPNMASTAQEQTAPLASTAQEQSSPNMASTAQKQSSPNMASTAQEQSSPNMASTAQEQSAPLASTAQEQSAHLASTSQEQSAPNMASTAQEQSSPNMASTAQEQSAPLASTAQEQSAPLASTAQEQSAPLASTVQEQSAPLASTAQEQSALLASTAQEQSALLASTAQEQSALLASTAQEQTAPLASTAQEQSSPNMASTAQEQSAPNMALTAQEQSAPNMASTAQEQSAPNMASTAQEQSAPNMASTAQEQSAPNMASTAQEQSAPLASKAQEQTAPNMASTAQEQSAPNMASTAQEQSAPNMASTAQEQSAPNMASTAQEQSAPNMASTAQEQSAPNMASTAQEQSAPNMASTAQEQSAPNMASTAQEQSAPNMASTAQEQSVPLASTAQEQSAPLASTTQEQSAPLASTAQEHLNKSQVSKKHTHVSAASSNANRNMEKKRTVLHAKSRPKTSTSTGTTSKCKTSSKMKDLSVAKTTKCPSVAKVGTTNEVPQAANVSNFGTVKPGVAVNRVGYTVLVNGVTVGKRKAAVEAPGQARPKEAAGLSYRKTYFRAPPTTYLDERFTNMPKRRKHMSVFLTSTPPKSPAPPPRHTRRCANCFAYFSHEEELQTHLRDNNCSSMFGFDSDEGYGLEMSCFSH